MARRAIVPVHLEELILMLVGMTVGAEGVRRVEPLAEFGALIALMALFALDLAVFAFQ
jgi:hypothetical protein